MEETADSLISPEKTQPCHVPDWDEVRRQIRALVVQDAKNMVAAAIDAVKDGHCQMMKYLFALAGLYPQAVEEKGEEDFSLARMLCERLGLSPAPDLDPDDVETVVIQADEKPAERGNGHALK